jgi:hypothetical protein
LRESDRLDPPVFSPATKAETGHDENITIAHMARIVGRRATQSSSDDPRGVRALGAIAEPRGIIIADTKFEFGARDGASSSSTKCSRPTAPLLARVRLRAGRSQPSFDKQPLRDYLDANASPDAGLAIIRRRRSRSRRAGDEHAVSRRLPPHHGSDLDITGALMNFAREGLAFIVIAALIAAAAYAAALTRRSWPLWLLAFVVTLVALWVAYFFRDPRAHRVARTADGHSALPTARS